MEIIIKNTSNLEFNLNLIYTAYKDLKEKEKIKDEEITKIIVTDKIVNFVTK